MSEIPRYLQLLWDRESPGRRGPRPRHSITDIAEAAVAIADREGLDAVTMKAVGAALGVTSMSLYRYVDTKEDLIAVMLDHAYGPPDPTLTARGSWRRRLEAWARAVAAGRLAHPWSVLVPITSPPVTPNVLGWTDCGLRAFTGVDLTAQQKLSSLLVVDGYVANHVRTATQMQLVGPQASEAEDYGTLVGAVFDPARFPHLAGALGALSDDDDFYDTELTFGLTVILDGIERLIGRS